MSKTQKSVSLSKITRGKGMQNPNPRLKQRRFQGLPRYWGFPNSNQNMKAMRRRDSSATVMISSWPTTESSHPSPSSSVRRFSRRRNSPSQ
jgi:hypothetical protein